MPQCVERHDGVQGQGQRPKAVTGTWSEALWFAAIAIGYMIVMGFATR